MVKKITRDAELVEQLVQWRKIYYDITHHLVRIPTCLQEIVGATLKLAMIQSPSHYKITVLVLKQIL